MPKLAHSTQVSFKNLHQAHSTYYGVTLDGTIQKTLLKDDLVIPSKPLAEAIALEWDSQPDEMILSNLSLNKIMTKNFKILNDPREIQEMRDELYTLLEND